MNRHYNTFIVFVTEPYNIYSVAEDFWGVDGNSEPKANSGQTFHKVDIEFEDEVTVLELRLKGVR